MLGAGGSASSGEGGRNSTPNDSFTRCLAVGLEGGTSFTAGPCLPWLKHSSNLDKVTALCVKWVIPGPRAGAAVL